MDHILSSCVLVYRNFSYFDLTAIWQCKDDIAFNFRSFFRSQSITSSNLLTYRRQVSFFRFLINQCAWSGSRLSVRKQPSRLFVSRHRQSAQHHRAPANVNSGFLLAFLVMSYLLFSRGTLAYFPHCPLSLYKKLSKTPVNVVLHRGWNGGKFNPTTDSSNLKR